MADTDIRWITDDQGLREACAHWQQQPVLALDTEFMRTETFYPEAGLIQLSDGQTVWLLDPLPITTWQPFAQWLESPNTLKVLHSCSEDLEVLQRLCAALPTPLFDTQLAAAFLGLGHSMGYARLVHEVLGLELPKGETRSDWLQRPLSEMQIRYAAEDTLHLFELYQALEARLDATKRGWLLDDCAEQIAAARLSKDPREAYLDVKLAWKLRPQQLAVLRELCAWRETEARRRNVARNRLLRERSLWPLARFQPDNLVALARIEDMHPRTVRQDGETLLQLMAAGKAVPQSDWPETPEPPMGPEVSAVLKRLRNIGKEKAEQLAMAPEIMLRKKALEALLRSGYKDGDYRLPDDFNGWRKELFGEQLLAELNGEPA
ncbi:ribonuclease D [Atopomonas hussainii]|uniref:Ribonuclease D n=1 Tax=Atopomonas hussainii TaxID=1429083 RepID=A0A1H7H5F3_9GAMM|nr:ribonuclease D [Atopomonas hussainii]SEK45626.1 ribonuclease D [Atopomonas hussainii]